MRNADGVFGGFECFGGGGESESCLAQTLLQTNKVPVRRRGGGWHATIRHPHMCAKLLSPIVCSEKHVHCSGIFA